MNLTEGLFLSSMMGNGGGGGGGGETTILVPEQNFTATTSGSNFYYVALDAESWNPEEYPTITVEFDGMSGEVTNNGGGDYGAQMLFNPSTGTSSMDFSTYPFEIAPTDNGVMIAVADTNEHTVKVTGEQISSIYIDENGTYDVKNYGIAEVDVPTGITPSGTINITSNGTYTVETYYSASVSVDPPALGSITLSISNANPPTITVRNFVEYNGARLQTVNKSVSSGATVGIVKPYTTSAYYYLNFSPFTGNVSSITGASGGYQVTTLGTIVAVKDGDNVVVTIYDN